MNTMDAYSRSMAAKGSPQRTFDWDKAARLIRERKPTTAGAGLSGDWEYTGGTIYENGQPVTDSYTYLSSNWATPEMEMDGETVECWVYEKDTDGWNCDTKWPPSALAIITISPLPPSRG